MFEWTQADWSLLDGRSKQHARHKYKDDTNKTSTVRTAKVTRTDSSRRMKISDIRWTVMSLPYHSEDARRAQDSYI